MKLKVYNQQNSKNSITGKPTVRIHRPSGIMSFSKAACQLIGVASGDKIVIVQDEDEPADFFIHKTNHPDGFTLRAKADNAGASFNCSKIAALLTPGLTAVAYPVSGAQVIDGMSYHLIVTSKHLNAVIKAPGK